jgi:hypothetical protein
MKGSFILGLTYGTRFFQQICLNVCPCYVTRSIKIDANKLTLKKKKLAPINIS